MRTRGRMRMEKPHSPDVPVVWRKLKVELRCLTAFCGGPFGHIPMKGLFRSVIPLDGIASLPPVRTGQVPDEHCVVHLERHLRTCRECRRRRGEVGVTLNLKGS